MNILTFPTNEMLDEAAAGLIASNLQENPFCVLGLATGSTPVGVYSKLAEWNQAGKFSFRNAQTVNLDEYLGLPQDHPQSYYSFMKTKLFRHIDLPGEMAYIPDGSTPDAQEECRRYDRILERNPVQLQLLGLGHNGHIGFNEPDRGLKAGTHIVKLDPQTRQANARFFGSADQVPTHAITMGMAGILKAGTILLVVRGQDKAEIVRRALTGPITTDCPASLLQTHPRLIVMLDQEAGRLLA